VTVITELLSFFFAHGHKAFMIIVMRQLGGCFRRRIPEKEKKSSAEYYKEQIVDQYFLFSVNFFVHPIPLGVLICSQLEIILV